MKTFEVRFRDGRSASGLSSGDLKRWAAEGRLCAEDLIRDIERETWHRVGSVPQLAAALTVQPVAVQPAPACRTAPAVPPPPAPAPQDESEQAGADDGEREYWVSLGNSAGWRWALEPSMDGFVPTGTDADVADHYRELLTFVAAHLRTQDRLIRSLAAADSTAGTQAMGPLNEEEAELVVFLACNGPWRGRSPMTSQFDGRFQGCRPIVQVWDPRHRDWRRASAVFPQAHWGTPAWAGAGSTWGDESDHTSTHAAISDRNPFGWKRYDEGAVYIDGCLMEEPDHTGRFFLEERGHVCALECFNAFDSVSREELMWLRSIGCMDALVWVLPLTEDVGAGHHSATAGPPSDGWMLIDDVIAMCRDARSVQHNPVQPLQIPVQHAHAPTHAPAAVAPPVAPAHGGEVSRMQPPPAHLQPPQVHQPPRAPSTGQQILTTAAGVGVAFAGARAITALGQKASEWAQAHNAPEVLSSMDVNDDGLADMAILDTNDNGLLDGTDTLVLGDAAQGAVDAGNSVLDSIVDFFS